MNSNIQQDDAASEQHGLRASDSDQKGRRKMGKPSHRSKSSGSSQVRAPTKPKRPERPPPNTERVVKTEDVLITSNFFSANYGVGGGLNPDDHLTFSDNFIGWTDLVEHSFEKLHFPAQASKDIGLPLVLYLVYCHTMLWRRIFSIDAANGRLPDAFYEELRKLESLGDLPLPNQLILYLKGIGNFSDRSGLAWQFTSPIEYQRWSETTISGLKGHLGANPDADARSGYCTIPMPYVYTKRAMDQEREASYPTISDISPVSTYPVLCTTEILGYGKNPSISDRELQLIKSCGLKSLDESDFNGSAINLSHKVMNIVASKLGKVLAPSEVYTVVENANPRGSMAQIVFNEYSLAYGYDRRRLTETEPSTCHSMTKMSQSLWFAGFVFQYRYLNAATPVNGVTCGQGWYQKRESGESNILPLAPTSGLDLDTSGSLLSKRFQLEEMVKSELLRTIWS